MKLYLISSKIKIKTVCEKLTYLFLFSWNCEKFTLKTKTEVGVNFVEGEVGKIETSKHFDKHIAVLRRKAMKIV